jgi:predicted RNase H-like HicB family nuclease
MVSVDDTIQSSALLPRPTPDLCLGAQEEEWQAASAPSERLKLFHHMTAPDTLPATSLEYHPTKKSFPYLDDYDIVEDFVLHSADPKSTEALNLVCSFEEKWPTVPPIEILHGEPWEIWEKPIIRMNTRLTNNIEDALTNLSKAGCLVSESEKTFLSYIITHRLAWSASDPQHMEEPCFKYIQHSFRHLGHLYPILDDIWWPEVVESLPDGINPSFLLRVLLSNEQNYYVYLPEVDIMYKAGSTLEEVFQGLKEFKDQSIPEGGSWEYEEGPGWTGEGHYRHFQMWATAKDSSREWEPAWEVEPFIPPDAS